MGNQSWKIRLRSGIAAILLGTTIPLIVGLVAYIYLRNTELALRVADEAVDRIVQEAVGEIERILAQNRAVVEVTAAGILVPGRRMDDSVLPVFVEILMANPLLASIYVGFEQDGIFYQTLRLPTDSAIPFGSLPWALAQEDEQLYRSVHVERGKRVESVRYRGADGLELHREEGATTYDPRQRSWYRAAWDKDEPVVSPAFVLTHSGEPGFTLSRRILQAKRSSHGVVGVDISLKTLSEFLSQRSLPHGGMVFVVDRDRKVAGYSDPQLLLALRDGKVALRKLDDFPAAVQMAFAQWRQTSEPSFVFTDPASNVTCLAALAPVAATGDASWVVGAIVPQEAFTGPIREVTLSLAAVSLAVILTAAALVLRMSRLLTGPIKAVVQETERIRRFDLSDDFHTDSNIVEIRALAASVRAMKNALHSFSLFVPKDIVRDLIVRGDTANLGGQRRQVTVLFSDIENFTAISESLPPEAVMMHLSNYFDALNPPIHRYAGVVDKFIGDAIMAIWNAPILDKNHPVHACQAALACCEASRLRYREALATGQPAFRTRFGLHAGEAVVGTVGSLDRMQFTVLGANVNLASRIERFNKYYGSDIIVTAAVEREVGRRFLLAPLDIVQPAGVAQPVELFMLLGPADPAAEIRLEAWRLIVASFRAKEWRRCLALLDRFSDPLLPTETVQLFSRRCRSLLEQAPNSWSPVVSFAGK